MLCLKDSVWNVFSPDSTTFLIYPMEPPSAFDWGQCAAIFIGGLLQLSDSKSQWHVSNLKNVYRDGAWMLIYWMSTT